MAQVSGSRVGGLGRAHRDEVEAPPAHVGGTRVGGEAQVSIGDTLIEDVLQARLVEGRAARCQRPHLIAVNVDADDVVAQGRHAGGVDGAKVSATDNCHFHGSALSRMGCARGGVR